MALSKKKEKTKGDKIDNEDAEKALVAKLFWLL